MRCNVHSHQYDEPGTRLSTIGKIPLVAFQAVACGVSFRD